DVAPRCPHVGSTALVVGPGDLKGGFSRFDVGTAGSIALVLQTLMPLLPCAPGTVEVEITGGTDVKWSPPIDYLRLVTLPLLDRMSAHASILILRRGHYPMGGGVVRITATPVSVLKNIVGKEGGDVIAITGVSHSVKLPIRVAERQASAVTRVIERKSFPRPKIEIDASEKNTHLGPGSGIVLCATTSKGGVLGADSLGERGRPAE